MGLEGPIMSLSYDAIVGGLFDRSGHNKCDDGRIYTVTTAGSKITSKELNTECLRDYDYGRWTVFTDSCMLFGLAENKAINLFSS
ncbi:hypothetical protein BSL78_02161 [Apostichopus japonicus]|uniref:Uncharacterized protein n=1 Tax=Stichopus japonicus TaxID=307972 RepID=A0A2G8LL53_STIJA|nr:hypothetical protein BSL78_02161 [Apostichopus japonicus]